MGLNDVFLPLAMNPLCPLKATTGGSTKLFSTLHNKATTGDSKPGHRPPVVALSIMTDNTLLWEELFRWLRNAAGPLDVPLW